MLRFVGGSVIITIAVSAILLFAGYIKGSADIQLTEQGKESIYNTLEYGKSVVNDNVSNIQTKLKSE